MTKPKPCGCKDLPAIAAATAQMVPFEFIEELRAQYSNGRTANESARIVKEF